MITRFYERDARIASPPRYVLNRIYRRFTGRYCVRQTRIIINQDERQRHGLQMTFSKTVLLYLFL